MQALACTGLQSLGSTSKYGPAHTGTGPYWLIRAILGMGDLLTQIWVVSLISRARTRPRVYTRTRIMRARGRAHAPARGDKSLTCSRISYFAYAVLGLALIQGIG